LPDKIKEYYDEGFNDKFLKDKARIQSEVERTADECAESIFDMFIDPKPETRFMFGDSVALIKVLKHLHDSVHDLFMEKLYWSQAKKDKYKK